MHGGDIYRNKVKLDFSINVNPMGMPANVREAVLASIDDAEHYPDPYCAALREKLSMRCGTDPDDIVCGNGASELIQALIMAVSPKKALLYAPCFTGYEKALERFGVETDYIALDKQKNFVVSTIPKKSMIWDTDLVMLANPGNPAGTLTDRALLYEMADAFLESGTTLVVDECFLALTGREDVSVLSDMAAFRKHKNLIALNAFTKTYAIPGLRIGYAVFADRKMAEKTEELLPDWNCSVPAQAAGAACLETDPLWLCASVSLIAKERAYLKKRLQRIGACVYPSEANYLLFYLERDDLYESLLKKGILIRDCSDYRTLGKGWYRIAVRKHEENEALVRAMEDV